MQTGIRLTRCNVDSNDPKILGVDTCMHTLNLISEQSMSISCKREGGIFYIGYYTPATVQG